MAYEHVQKTKPSARLGIHVLRTKTPWRPRGW